MDWQPIESCPKDGRHFDVWVVSEFAPRGYRMTTCKWGVEDYDFGKKNPGVMFHGPDEVERFRYVWKRFEDVTPTHWMPEPEPPE